MAADLTPQSPDVQDAVAKGIRYLESAGANDDRAGARALVGLAILKHGGDGRHPRVAQAVQAIRAGINFQDPSQIQMDIYSTGLSIIFLVTLDPSQYSAEILALMRSLQFRQKPHGGWGYPPGHQHALTGDTSMTQYGVLSTWEAAQVGFKMPQETVDAVATWLLRTQDPSGGFGYQGTVSPTFTPVKQDGVRLSMTAAGLGSLYICSALLGIAEPIEREEDLPPALREVKEKQAAPEVKTRVDAKLVREAQQRGNRWMTANYQIDPPGWTHYYLYALERYWSFRELIDGPSEHYPKWYNDGARYLLRTQKPDGSWQSQSGQVPDTAFAILFLLRSTKKSIERSRELGAGLLVGGRGLPKETAGARVRGGQVVAKPMLGSADALLAAMENPANEESVRTLESLAELAPEEVRTLLSGHAAKLRTLAGGTSADARLAAVRALAATRDIREVPTLIYALTDPDPPVVLAADEGLRRIARRLSAKGLPEKFTEEQRRQAIQAWKEWYLAVRPDAEFEE